MTEEEQTPLVERRERGVIRHESSVYGTSVEGVDLVVYLPDESRIELMILAAIHGDEAETTVVVSEALRSLPRGDLRAAVILSGNPDGLLRGTRGNARGVDLNRNCPTANWTPDPVFYKTRENDARDISLTTGTAAGSEPETAALISLIDELKPRAIVSLHSALACMDDSRPSRLGKRLAELTSLPLVGDIGYATPGSMGTWAAERQLDLVTWELENASIYDLKDRNVPLLIDLMTGRIAIGD